MSRFRQMHMVRNQWGGWQSACRWLNIGSCLTYYSKGNCFANVHGEQFPSEERSLEKYTSNCLLTC